MGTQMEYTVGMITAADLKARVNAQPFAPFRVCMSDGKTFDVIHHDMMMVTRNIAYIGINLGPEDIAEHGAQCAILHITRLEDIVPEKAA